MTIHYTKGDATHPQGSGPRIIVHVCNSIGCGLAGGKWDEIEPIIERCLMTAGVQVTVYDFG